MGILDDKNVIRQRDPEDLLSFLAKQPEQLLHDYGIAHGAKPQRDIHNVVLAGMGGSALCGELVRTWPGLRVPFVVCKDYTLPAFVNEHTLVICSSYSGNTEETLACLQQACKRKAQVVIASYGGKLKEEAEAGGEVHAAIPLCPQPRTGVFYMFRAVVEIFVAANLVPASALNVLKEASAHLEKAITHYTPDVPQAENPAKKLAQQIAGKTAVMYAGPLMYPAAYKWKIDINEMAKNTAWCNYLPEFNHNEFIGWSSHPIDKPFAVIDLLSEYEHPRTQKRFEVTGRMLSGKRPKAIDVRAKGQNVLEHMLDLIVLGDFASTYLALLNGVDPTPVDLVEKFKKELG